MMNAPNVWLITGTTSGIGSALVEYIAARGDKVIATGRCAEERLGKKASNDIVPLDLDVTASLEDIRRQVDKAIGIFGHIDAVVSNAGWTSISSIEEADEGFLRRMFDTNLFGAFKITQAILPHFRQRKAGTIGFVGAAFAWSSFPFMAHYAIAKAGLSIFVEALQKEVAHLGIRAVVFESGAFATGLGQARLDGKERLGGPPRIPDYEALFKEMSHKFMREVRPALTSDIAKFPQVVWDVMKGDGGASTRPFPIRVPVGDDALAVMKQKCQEQLLLCDRWQDVATSVSDQPPPPAAVEELLRMLSILNMTT